MVIGRSGYAAEPAAGSRPAVDNITATINQWKRFTGWASSAGNYTAWLDMQVSTCILWMTDTDKVFKALADPSRRKLLDLLYANDGQSLGELCEHLDMSRQAGTQPLAVLEAANLVATSWRGGGAL